MAINNYLKFLNDAIYGHNMKVESKSSVGVIGHKIFGTLL